jgi:hypothetical protein
MFYKVLNIFSIAFNKNQAKAKALKEAFLKYNLVKYYIKLAKKSLHY